MTQLAIKGHATRGRKVIEILEMLGGKNKQGYNGKYNSLWYYIDVRSEIGVFKHSFDGCNFFTLEEFLEKFPFKIGDKVTHNMGILMNVVHMYWDAECNVIRYDIQLPVDNNYKLKAMLAEHLQPYKEEIMKEKKVNQMSIANCDLDEVEIVLGDKFELVNKEGKYYAVKKKPQYPKTFEECCAILGLTELGIIGGYRRGLLTQFRNLLICRDAYWKIAGDWKPEFRFGKKKYCIMTKDNKVISATVEETNRILTFPTEEMRDAFYENFKELIEECKELL